MGNNASQLEKDIGCDQFPANEHYFGLINFGNTCYCNSVLQALYFCKPFREKVLEYKAKNKRNNTNRETLLTCLADLFYTIATQKKKTGTIPPKKFITKLRKDNDVFDNYMQQDAHEFLNYLLNTIADLLIAENNMDHLANGYETTDTQPKINLHQIIRNSRTITIVIKTCRCRSEHFHTQCLRVFSNTETLSSEHKYYCENCCSKQEAQKRMRIKKLPMILALHLKRFKYTESQNRHAKLSYRVVFPFELRLFNKSSDDSQDKLYDLMAVVIHCGSGPNRGHYITIVKSFGFWLLFDDDIVDKIDPSTIEDFFGLTSDTQKNSESGYILFYQSRYET
ncbi:Ubiquitin carboxyl-terminal hydrolase 46 [Sarcoptes scabiei]|uniref:ubiquitinyl hydrolase 1 n=1 Tax=Sarcoptes scabiei TaxID=52283 RepID=A0A834RAR8_SARSC|nr:Ubiquitin carboxyl-terminal hydrolase 46 [Sarcoptes scabiei]